MIFIDTLLFMTFLDDLVKIVIEAFDCRFPLVLHDFWSDIENREIGCSIPSIFRARAPYYRKLCFQLPHNHVYGRIARVTLSWRNWRFKQVCQICLSQSFILQCSKTIVSNNIFSQHVDQLHSRWTWCSEFRGLQAFYTWAKFFNHIFFFSYAALSILNLSPRLPETWKMQLLFIFFLLIILHFHIFHRMVLVLDDYLFFFFFFTTFILLDLYSDIVIKLSQGCHQR